MRDLMETDEDRAYQAYKLRQEGHDWKVIAEQVGFANAKTAEVNVRIYLQKAMLEVSHEQRMEALLMEMDRLDKLMAAYWPTAMAGEVKHAELILKTIQTRARLLGLEELHIKTAGTTKTVVISGTTEEFTSALAHFVEDD
jgi:hypothetical protein